jgi:hypothetical protein
LGGNVLELGGFARLVHNHDIKEPIVLRAEFATPGSLERFGRDLTGFPFADLDDEIESAWLEVTVRYRTSATFRGPFLERATVGVGSERTPLVWLETRPHARDGEAMYARINLRHPMLASEHREFPVWDVDTGTQKLFSLPSAPIAICEAWEQIAIPEEDFHRAIDREPKEESVDPFGQGLGSMPVFALKRARFGALPMLGEPLRVVAFGDESVEAQTTEEHVRAFLEMVVLGTTAQLASFLRGAIYVGPLRTIPRRGSLYEGAGRIASWADGLAAWDLLLADRFTLVEQVNGWLRRLGTGCQVVVQQLFHRSAAAEEIAEGHVDTTVRRLLLETGAGSLVLPSEVGAGISQLVPVVVAALEGRTGLTLIEQPEIHVHPAVQVGLGDLFIEAVGREGSRRTIVIETHSEHLILRLLRRIRETTEHDLSEGAPAFGEDQLSVLYVEATPDGVQVSRLRVDEHGEFKDRWPKGFFAERMMELL